MRTLTAITGFMRRAPALRRGRRFNRLPMIIAAVVIGVAFSGTALWEAQRSGKLAAVGNAIGQVVAAAGGKLGLTVASVEVEGRVRTDREAILAALGVERGTPILALDPHAAKARLEALPWVRSAAVERQLPNAVFVRIVEREPLAIWQSHGQRHLIDREGAVVHLESITGFATKIELVGEDAPTQGATLVDMLATEPDLAQHVVSAVRYGGRRWNLQLDDHVEVALPAEDAAGAWHRLAKLEHDDHLLERNIEAVDLRLPDRLVVRVVPEPPKPAASKKKAKSAKPAKSGKSA